MYCNECGIRIEDQETLFCPQCGSPVNRGTDPKADKRHKKSKKTRKRKSHKTLAILLTVLGCLLIVAGAALMLLPKLLQSTSPLLVVEDNQLIYLDALEDKKGIVLDSKLADVEIVEQYSGTTAAASSLSSCVRYSEDGNYAFYFSDYEPDTGTFSLKQVELSRVKKAGKEAVQTVASHVESPVTIVADTVLYHQWIRDSDSAEERYRTPLQCYSISKGKSNQISEDCSQTVILTAGYAISEDGKTVLFGEAGSEQFSQGGNVYLYHVETQEKQPLAKNAVVTHCSEDLGEIIYYTEDGAYRATAENGEILTNECTFSLEEDTELKNGWITYADSTAVIFGGEDQHSAIQCGVYRDGITTTWTGNGGLLLPLNVMVRTDSKFPWAETGNTMIGGVDVDLEAEKTFLVEPDLQPYAMKVSYYDIGGFAWDSDRSIAYVLYQVEEDAQVFDLYAYPLKADSITDEILIARGCGGSICYHAGSQTLFYYEDYDAKRSCGTLCAIVAGGEPKRLVKNAYAPVESYTPLACGLQFDDKTPYALCWADVEDGMGSLYALDLNAAESVIALGNRVCLTGWTVYEEDILFVGDIDRNKGGTLYRFDGTQTTPQREGVMGVAGASSHYNYKSMLPWWWGR